MTRTLTKPIDNPRAALLTRDRIHPASLQPRHDITAEKIARKRAELKQDGQLTPIHVRPHQKRGGHFVIVDGELRYRGSEPGPDWKGLETLAVVIRDDLADDADAYMISAKANITEGMTDFDWAMTVFDLHDRFAVSLSEINRRFNEGRNWAENRWAAANGTRDIPELRDKLKSDGNLYKVKEVAGQHPRLRREILDRWDSLTSLESVRAYIADWNARHKPATPSPRAAPVRHTTSPEPFELGTPSSRGRDVTGTRPPNARHECEQALDQIDRHVRTVLAWWEHLTPAARKQLKARTADIAGALEDLQ